MNILCYWNEKIFFTIEYHIGGFVQEVTNYFDNPLRLRFLHLPFHSNDTGW